MKNNGFTLVEVIAIIVIIAILALITVPIVDRIINEGREGTYESAVATILDAAYDYVQLKPSALPDSVDGAVSTFTLSDIKKEGLLKIELINPKTKAQFSNTSIIRVTYYAEYTGAFTNKQKAFGNYVFEFIES